MFLLGFIDPINTTVDGETKSIPQPQNDNVIIFIFIMFSIVPASLTLISFCIKKTFPIKNKEMVEEIAKGIEKHMHGEPAYDPITDRNVWIEKFNDEEQYIVDCLDHFRCFFFLTFFCFFATFAYFFCVCFIYLFFFAFF